MVTRVVNGTISGGYTLDAQYNTLSISTTGEIVGGGYGVTSLHNATVTNYGSIINSQFASIDLRAGGLVVNGSAGNTKALINQGVYILNTAGTVNNFGTIMATKNGNTSKYIFGVFLNDGGSVTNGSGSSYAAYIGGAGINITGAAGTIKNFGQIEANNNGGVGISLSSGSVTNGSAADTSALISGAAIGLATSHYANVSNFGTIQSAGLGVQWAGGTLTNGPAGDTKAEIVGAYGVSLTGAAAVLKNFGTIMGTSGAAVYIGKIGGGASVSVTNGASSDTTALIMGGSYGVLVNAAAVTVTNYGTIGGTGGKALQFNASSDLLIVEGGSSFVGLVQGGGGTLQLAAGTGTIANLGTSFSGFGNYAVQSGGSWTVTGTNTLGAGTTLANKGTMLIGGTLSDAGSFANFGAVSGLAGGIALQFAGGALSNSGVVTGGAGGAGAGGGTAVLSAGSYLTSNDAIYGGAGGASQGAYAGGAGGTGVQSSGSSLVNTGVIAGGVGGASQSGVGGGGGMAVQVTASAITNKGTIAGGAGGSGGSANVGGAGGAGIYLSRGSVLTNISTGLIEGGMGGGGGGGGSGGIAAFLAGGYLSNNGVILGGAGGAGGKTGKGAGGAGAYVSGGGELTNKGQVIGGTGAGKSATGVVISGAGTVDNFGTIMGGAYSVVITGGGGVLKVESGSVLTGAVQGGGGTLELAGGYGTVTNLGATGTISGNEAATFSGFGSYQNDAGTYWNFAGADTIASRTTFTDNGRLSSSGSLTLSGTISGTGSLTVIGGTATLNVGAALTVATVELQAGTVFVNESLTYRGVFTQDARSTLTLGNNDTLVISNAVRLAGLIDGAGTLSVASASIAAFSVVGTDVLIDTGSITQTGAVANGGGTAGKAGILVAKGATWTILGGTVILRAASNSFMDVEGTFVGSCALGPSRISNAVVVGGVIEAAAGTLTLAGAVTGTGALNIDSGAILTVSSSVDSGLTANFEGAAGTLVLRQNAKSFSATIAGFGAGDTIDLLNTAATGGSVNGNDQLVIVNGTKLVATLQLSGNYSGDTFSVGSDGNGGTDVTVSGPKTPSAHAFVAAMAGFAPSFAGHALASFAPARNAFHTTLFVREA
jgi:fibronectin-binding autotransporter adhesin